MVNREVGSMEHTTHCGDFAVCSDGMAPVANGIGSKLARLGRRLTDALAQHRQRDLDREVGAVFARSGGRIMESMEREIMRRVLASDWSPPQ
jgi:hypothetical protein